MLRYDGRTADGRMVYLNERGQRTRFATPEWKQPSPRRRTICVYADGSSRQPRVGAEIIGHPVWTIRVNLPRSR